METTAQNSSPKSINKKRITFVDGLRGIAALLVILFHNGGFWLKTPDTGYLTTFMLNFSSYGYLGVEIFFVISGFSIACSLNSFDLNRDSFTRFLIRRVIRLTPLYYTSILLTFVLALLCKHFITSSHQPFPIPSYASLLAHLFYLQDILGFPEINVVYWTLCIEIQFYIVFGLLVMFFRRLQSCTNQEKSDKFTIYYFVFFSLLSYLFPLLKIEKLANISGLFLPYWYMFSTGTIIYWCIRKLIPRNLIFIILTCLTLTFLRFDNLELIVSSSTAITIYLASIFQGLYTWLAAKPFQFLGKVSYSLYIIHTPVAVIILSLCNHLTHRTELSNSVFFSCSILIAVICSSILFFVVESPAIEWSRKIKRSIATI